MQRLIGQCILPMRAALLLTGSQACLRHAGALAARPWVCRSPGRWPGIRLSPPSSLIPRP